MQTMTKIAERAGVTLYDHVADLVGDVEPAVQHGLCFQGDVAFIPTRPGIEELVDLPKAGLVLVAGDHDHVLVADQGTCRVRVVAGGGQDVAVIDCDAPVHVVHAEHAVTALAAGRWTVRRQREQADEQRLVAD